MVERVDERSLDEDQVIDAAESILRRRLERLGAIQNPTDTIAFLRMRIGHLQHEEFHAVWLDARHRILSIDRLFAGSIDGASVYPREVVRTALDRNAAAVIFAHNHPSGITEPSSADRSITRRLKAALELIEVRVLDHIVVGSCEATSFAQCGWL